MTWRTPSPTRISSGTFTSVASLKSMTKRGGSSSGNVVKFGGREPSTVTITAPSRSETTILFSSLVAGSPALTRAAARVKRTRADRRMLTLRRETGRTIARCPERPNSGVGQGDVGVRLRDRLGGGAARRELARELDEVLHVEADLADVAAHRQLEVAVALHRPPQEVLAPRRAVDLLRRLDAGERIEVAEDDGHRDADVAEVGAEVVPG